MIAEQAGTERASSRTIARWSAYLEDLHARIAHRFLRPEVRERVRRYLAGLLADVRRKNGWQMAEAIGEARPRGVQHLLNDAHWNADAVRNDLRDYVVEHLGNHESGLLVVEETGFLKKRARRSRWGWPVTVHGDRRQEGELPGRGVPLLCLRERGGLLLDRAL